MIVRERQCDCEWESVCVWVWLRESKCGCDWERDSVIVNERESVRVCERERDCVDVREREYVWVWVSERERESACVCALKNEINSPIKSNHRISQHWRQSRNWIIILNSRSWNCTLGMLRSDFTTFYHPSMFEVILEIQNKPQWLSFEKYSCRLARNWPILLK